MNYKECLILQEFNTAKSRDYITVCCTQCNKTFSLQKHEIQLKAAKSNSRRIYCSKTCSNNHYKLRSTVACNCKQCDKQFTKKLSDLNKNKPGNDFCSQSCSGKYNNEHKETGTRRSKLEVYLEEQLNILYPALSIEFNKKTAINSELDIYIPSLKLAFELNGVFHYEPIYGQDKLESILNNDGRKFQACLEHGIELCIIDSSKQKRFTDKSSQKYLDIVINLINTKINNNVH
ncbi:MAG: hypothetical protein ABFD07_07255 [Methanobacterium sp.]